MDFMQQCGTVLGGWSKQHESLFRELRETLNESGQWATENAEPTAMVEFYSSLAKALGNTVMPDDSGSAAFGSNPFDYLMDPGAWIKAAAADVKLFGETNGDTGSFAGAADSSEQFSAAKDSWSALNASTTVYHEVILAAWAATGQQFIGSPHDKQ